MLEQKISVLLPVLPLFISIQRNVQFIIISNNNKQPSFPQFIQPSHPVFFYISSLLFLLFFFSLKVLFTVKISALFLQKLTILNFTIGLLMIAKKRRFCSHISVNIASSVRTINSCFPLCQLL